jgi:hypothetical protein
VLDYLGRPSAQIFTLGSAAKGMQFETTAVPELRVQAKALAERLLRPVAERYEEVAESPQGWAAEIRSTTSAVPAGVMAPGRNHAALCKGECNMPAIHIWSATTGGAW